MMNKTASRGIIWGMFLADSLALGPHWIYDTSEIAQKFGRIDHLLAPGTSYHPGKKAGDQTHLGDQAFVLFRSAKAGYDAKKFMKSWVAFWNDPKNISYRDHATQEALANIEAGKPLLEAGSASNELAGAARSLLLVALLDEKVETRSSVIEAAVNHARLTHNSEISLETAGFLAALVYDVLEGSSLEEAIKTNIASHPSLQPCLVAAEKVLAKDAVPAIAELGQSCALPGALAATLFLLLKYPNQPAEALVQNALAGGDSAARGLVLGAALGAIHGYFTWPAQWIGELVIGPVIK